MWLQRRFLSVLLVAVAVPMFAQQAVFKDVQTRHSRSAKDRRMVEKSATLILDDASRQLTVQSKHQPLQVSYDEIRKVIFDPWFHWCYLESGTSGDAARPYVLRVGEDSWIQVAAKRGEFRRGKRKACLR